MIFRISLTERWILPEFTFHINKKIKSTARITKEIPYRTARFLSFIFLVHSSSVLLSCPFVSCSQVETGKGVKANTGIYFSLCILGQLIQRIIVCSQHGVDILDHGSKSGSFLEEILPVHQTFPFFTALKSARSLLLERSSSMVLSSPSIVLL